MEKEIRVPILDDHQSIVLLIYSFFHMKTYSAGLKLFEIFLDTSLVFNKLMLEKPNMYYGTKSLRFSNHIRIF